MEKPLILVVEDEVEYSEKIANAVQSSDKYAASVAHSAKEALDTLKKHKGLFGAFPNRVRCIILDIKMPGMDGLRFLEKIRQEYDESIGVIMLTAYEDPAKWDRAIGGFVAAYIKKPFDRQDLLDKLDQFFSGDEKTVKKLYSKTLYKGFDRMEELRKGEKEDG